MGTESLSLETHGHVPVCLTPPAGSETESQLVGGGLQWGKGAPALTEPVCLGLGVEGDQGRPVFLEASLQSQA